MEIESREEQDFVWNIKKSSRKLSVVSVKLKLLFRICSIALDWSH